MRRAGSSGIWHVLARGKLVRGLQGYGMYLREVICSSGIWHVLARGKLVLRDMACTCER